jgi:hypothetical protein
MSRSNPSSTNSPATRFFEWKAKKGEVQYWDKTLGENGENVTVSLPFKFMYLEDVYTVGGGKKVGKKPHQEFIGYYSNAVKNTELKTGTFTVRDKNGIVTEGRYEDVKKESGVKLIVGLYIAFHDDEKQLQIGYLKITGSARGEWWDFCKTHRKETGVIAISRGAEEEDEQGNTYYLPAFSQSTNISDETEARALELDKTVQDYLTAYFAHKGDEEVVPETTGVAVAVGSRYDAQSGFNPSEENEEDLPF